MFFLVTGSLRPFIVQHFRLSPFTRPSLSFFLNLSCVLVGVGSGVNFTRISKPVRQQDDTASSLDRANCQPIVQFLVKGMPLNFKFLEFTYVNFF